MPGGGPGGGGLTSASAAPSSERTVAFSGSAGGLTCCPGIIVFCWTLLLKEVADSASSVVEGALLASRPGAGAVWVAIMCRRKQDGQQASDVKREAEGFLQERHKNNARQSVQVKGGRTGEPGIRCSGAI